MTVYTNLAAVLLLATACAPRQTGESAPALTDERGGAPGALPGTGPDPELPPPDTTAAGIALYSKVVPWPEGRTPIAPPGFRVSLFAEGLQRPRWLYVLPNGDVLVAESANAGSRA